ncbi:MAG: type II secretion system protein [Candidatus Gastranaerophilales bacterium]|nr:type II secretion system protein [Candidatus Gastranaerophilales bacterium]
MNKQKFFTGRKKGFTLAEVLIVLLVIGIIAAFTIPLLVSKINNAKFVTGLQKAAYTFSNMTNVAQIDVKMDNWNFDLPTEDLANEYIKPHLNVAKDCGTKTGEGCFGKNYTLRDGTADTDYDNSSDYYKLVTGDGVSIGIKGIQGCTNENPSVCIEYIVDVNGVNPPNTLGKDVHVFQTLAHLNAVVPYGTFKDGGYNPATGKWTFEETEVASTNCLSGDAKYCTAKIINDGWEIKY